MTSPTVAISVSGASGTAQPQPLEYMPIDVTPTAGPNVAAARGSNADSARNVGFELEARKRLAEPFLVGVNYTFVDSEVTLTPAAGTPRAVSRTWVVIALTKRRF